MNSKLISALIATVAVALVTASIVSYAHAGDNRISDDVRFRKASLSLVGLIFPEIAAPVINRHNLPVFGNTCPSLNMVGKIPTAEDIAAIKAHTCTKFFEGSVVIK
jgi:hypothetical protein